jgi:hypothetical protein
MREHFRTVPRKKPIVRTLARLVTSMMAGPEAEEVQLSAVLVGAVAAESRRLEVLGPTAYVNGGRQDDNIVGQMVVMGSVQDAYRVQQQYELHPLSHAGLDIARERTSDLMLCSIQAMAATRADMSFSRWNREDREEEAAFLRRGLQASVRQEAEAIVQIGRVQIESVDVWYSGATDGTTLREASLAAREAALSLVGMGSPPTSPSAEPPPTLPPPASIGKTGAPTLSIDEFQASENAAELAATHLYIAAIVPKSEL